MATDLLGPAASLLKGATDSAQNEQSIALQRQKQASDVSTADADRFARTLDTTITDQGANKRAALAQEGENQRTALKEQGDTEREQAKEAAQFITLTPGLAKGAAKATGDNSWIDQTGSKMRADVYSALLSYGAKTQKKVVKVADVQEGDQQYQDVVFSDGTTERLSGGGAKWDPNKNKGTKDSANDPLRLQNSIRQDEKILLKAISSGNIPTDDHWFRGMNDQEKATLAGLQSVAARMKGNMANLSTLEASKGMEPTTVSPDVTALIDKIVKPGDAAPPPVAPVARVMVLNPKGMKVTIPTTQLESALTQGYKRVPK